MKGLFSYSSKEGGGFFGYFSASLYDHRQRAMILLLNYIPFFQMLVLTLVLFASGWPLLLRILTGIVWIYVIPPLVARLLLWFFPISQQVIQKSSPDFIKWWALFSLQVIFCRFGFLEEILRIIPACYSAWLRLWGAKIGRLTYWAGGLCILDRPFLKIGDDVVFGASVRLNPHVISKNKQGETELILAEISIGDRTTIGGYSLLTAGTVIEADECTRAMLICPPFSHLRRGQREKKRSLVNKDNSF